MPRLTRLVHVIYQGNMGEYHILHPFKTDDILVSMYDLLTGNIVSNIPYKISSDRVTIQFKQNKRYTKDIKIVLIG